MLPNNNHVSNIENYINQSFLLYKKDILSLYKGSWAEEDLNETSEKQFKGFQYFLAIQLTILVYLDVIRGVNTDWNYFVTKYNLEKYSKCLKCNDINLDKIFEKFNLPKIGELGIDFQEIESTFVIEFEINSILISQNIKNILNEEEKCEIFIEDTCLYQKCN